MYYCGAVSYTASQLCVLLCIAVQHYTVLLCALLYMLQCSELHSIAAVCFGAPTKPDKWAGCCTFIQNNCNNWGIIGNVETNNGLYTLNILV